MNFTFAFITGSNLLWAGLLFGIIFGVAAHILPVGDFGKKRLPDLASLPEWAWYAALVVMAAAVFLFVARAEKKRVAQP